MTDIQLLEMPEQIPSSEVDEEILEIFSEEVEEVCQNIVIYFAAWKRAENDLDSLGDLRRAFHTLKGSGRMVGAMVIGELGWHFENVLNKVIEGTLSRSHDILSILEQVEVVIPVMLKQFQDNKPPTDNIVLLISQAYYLINDIVPTVETAADVKIDAISNDFPGLQLLDMPEQISGSEVDEEILEIFSEEVEEVLQNIIIYFADWKADQHDADATANLRRAFHTLKGSGRMVGAMVIGEFGWQFENMFNKIIDGILSRTEEILSLFEHIEIALPKMLTQFQQTQATTDDIIHLISQAHYLTTTHDTVLKNDDIEEIPAPLQKNTLDDIPDLPDLEFPQDDIEDNSLENTLDDIPDLPDLELPQDIEDNSDTDIPDLPDLELPQDIEDDSDIDIPDLPELDLSQSIVNDIVTPLNQKESVSDNTSIQASEDTSSEDFQEIKDLFLEESDEILEKTQSLLTRWMATPDDKPLMSELQRELHTLKGGANMVGITIMADLSHTVEDLLKRIVEGTAKFNTKLLDIVQECVDELSSMQESVRLGETLKKPIDLINQINMSLGNETIESIPEAIATPTNISDTPAKKPEFKKKNEDEEHIKIKVSLVEQLTNLAGELSISRAHMEQQQGEIKNHLSEMEQTVIRLRDQLRRLDIEAEAQIQSHSGTSALPEQDENDEDWDPLLMDRFSSVNELSRFLAESVNDLASIQDSIKKVTRQSDLLLLQQSRIGAELQDGIMRARMIPFSKVTNKFQILARKTAREVGKSIEFVINGDSIEFEKTVLDTVVTALEHMLRNAIDHGIEDAKTRQKTTKPMTGSIILEVSKEAAEIVIKLHDDGAGLNLLAIRRKAEKQGLLKSETKISDHHLMQFILKPGFSTASQVTMVSGRGVGMDVAISQIKELGGNLLIHSKTNVGSTFEIRLPVSLTITQALLVHIGEETMAVPINYLDAVMRPPRAEVLSDNPDEERYFKYMDRDYRVFQLGKLLGLSKTALIENPGIPTLLVHAAGCRVALLVDMIEGSKEIVVKSVGPQIGAIRWIAGATILGDGRVVLILDVPTILREENTLEYQKPIAEVVTEKKVIANTIMVVDDSVTVRRVTASLLKRHGLSVLTAKDGLDAVSTLQNSKTLPDVILLDVEMPRMDGYEFATIVRSTSDWKHIPIIMITSRMGDKHRKRAEKIGVNDYLGKPYKDTVLLKSINTLIKKPEATLN